MLSICLKPNRENLPRQSYPRAAERDMAKRVAKEEVKAERGNPRTQRALAPSGAFVVDSPIH